MLNGDVTIDDYVYLGSNCNISSSVRVGRQSFIGANALITKDTDARAFARRSDARHGHRHMRFIKLLRDHH